MMNVSNASCGPGGYVCLDPEGQIMGPEKSKRLFAFVMAASVANRAIQLSVSPSTFAAACNGSYPVVEDVRWP
jgi:hypothetical protein